ncbi:MAG TPA: hypothetical protein ENL12_05060 [Dehalococcoidia bacterium]|nr:hypothetical protein [Dehalococcoidia bacterium]
MENHAKKTWKSTTAGVLSIVAGSLTIGLGLLVALSGSILSGILAAVEVPRIAFLIPLPVFGILAAPLVVLGTIAIIGGVQAIKRTSWPLALAGAICALVPPPVGILGVLAIVFVVLGRDEFA